MIVIERAREIRDREMEAGPPLEGHTRESGNRVNLRKLRLGVTKLLRPPLAYKVAAPRRQIRTVTTRCRWGTFRTYIRGARE